MYKNNKGLSDIVTTLIIIALALVAVGVVWYVFQNAVSQGQEKAEQASDDVFGTCPTAGITDATDSKSVCAEGEEVRIVGGEYCCVTA